MVGTLYCGPIHCTLEPFLIRDTPSHKTLLQLRAVNHNVRVVGALSIHSWQ